MALIYNRRDAEGAEEKRKNPFPYSVFSASLRFIQFYEPVIVRAPLSQGWERGRG